MRRNGTNDGTNIPEPQETMETLQDSGEEAVPRSPSFPCASQTEANISGEPVEFAEEFVVRLYVTVVH